VKESFFLIDPSTLDFGQFTPEFVVHAFLGMFVVAVKIAAPIMAILFFISVGLGLVARTVPQMNVFIVGFPLQIGAGLFMIAVSMPLFSIVIQNEILLLPEKILGLMRSL
jgi:flagellar biosynthetic protein FliR